MKSTTTLSTITLIIAAGSFALLGACSKSEQTSSTEATPSAEVATTGSQETAPASTEQATTGQAATPEQSGNDVAKETE